MVCCLCCDGMCRYGAVVDAGLMLPAANVSKAGWAPPPSLAARRQQLSSRPGMHLIRTPSAFSGNINPGQQAR